jgi:hypothetical protein
MRRETGFQPLEAQVADLNRVHAGAHPAEVLARVLADHPGRAATVSSFGAESVVLLHLLAQVDRAAPVLFLDTEMLFASTLAYQRDVAERLGLTGVQVIRPEQDRHLRARSGGRPPPQGRRPLLRAAKDRTARRRPARLHRLDHGSEAAPDGGAQGAGDLRGRRRGAAQGQPARRVDDSRGRRIYRRPRSAPPSAGARALPFHRLRALHDARRPGRGRAGRALARARQGGMRDPHRGRPHPCARRTGRRPMEREAGTVLVTARGVRSRRSGGILRRCRGSGRGEAVRCVSSFPRTGIPRRWRRSSPGRRSSAFPSAASRTGGASRWPARSDVSGSAAASGRRGT